MLHTLIIIRSGSVPVAIGYKDFAKLTPFLCGNISYSNNPSFHENAICDKVWSQVKIEWIVSTWILFNLTFDLAVFTDMTDYGKASSFLKAWNLWPILNKSGVNIELLHYLQGCASIPTSNLVVLRKSQMSVTKVS